MILPLSVFLLLCLVYLFIRLSLPTALLACADLPLHLPKCTSIQA